MNKKRRVMIAVRRPKFRYRRHLRIGCKRLWQRLQGRSLMLGALIIPLMIAGGLCATDLPTRAAFISGEVFNEMVAASGLRINNVLVKGRMNMAPEPILEALGVTRGDSILSFDPVMACEALEALPWIKRARVERRLPDTVFVELVERAPLALWQKDGRFALVDTEGTIVTDKGLEAFAWLPVIIGENAPSHAPDFLPILAAEQLIAERMSVATLVAPRRWVLTLNNGMRIKLPADNVGYALRQLARFQADDAIFERDAVAIDFRIGDRLVFETRADPKTPPEEKGQKI
ncbi:MAG: FtsQ-type POTRA domain-containing protein [Pseudomonadota bacterium]|nr:FtsQ-type POTRA domain-containing protein [Pseudomonadota bacterium]